MRRSGYGACSLRIYFSDTENRQKRRLLFRTVPFARDASGTKMGEFGKFEPQMNTDRHKYEPDGPLLI